MAEFMSLEITVGRDFDENGGDFRTIKVDKTHAGRLQKALSTLYRIGYEVVSAVFDGYSFTEDIWEYIDGNSLSNLLDAFDVFCMEKSNVDIVVAFLMGMPSSEVLNWEDCVWFRGSDHEDVVRQWVNIFHRRYEEVSKNYYDSVYIDAEVFPDWMATDENFWVNTLDSIASRESSVVVEFNDEVYYFG